MEEFDPSASDCLVGIIKVEIPSLSFPWGREVGFRWGSQGFDRNSEGNYIPVFLNSTELQLILRASHLTGEHLKQTIYNKSYRPLIYTGQTKLHCLHGKHRIEAAKSVLHAEDSWWIVKLYHFNLRSTYVRAHPNLFSD